MRKLRDGEVVGLANGDGVEVATVVRIGRMVGFRVSNALLLLGRKAGVNFPLGGQFTEILQPPKRPEEIKRKQ